MDTIAIAMAYNVQQSVILEQKAVMNGGQWAERGDICWLCFSIAPAGVTELLLLGEKSVI